MLTEYDVFISYSHLDVGWVKEWLLPRLETAGLSVCIDSRDFEIGVPSLTNMENAVERSRKTLLVLTPNWVKSEWTKFESLMTQTEDPSGVRQRTLPLLLEKCELPKRLGIFTYADFTDKTQSEAQLARVIGAITEQPPTQPTSKSILQPNFVHPYPLQANFTGRVKEREELNAWLSDDEHPIYELIAMGGMGKSALTWYWVKNDVLKSADVKLGSVMWWSFYEGESSFAKFVDEALKYASGKPTDVEQFPTTYDRAQELRTHLQNKRILFVLDGFERQLRDYASLDAAYKSDEKAKLSRDARSCVDPITSRLLRDIASTTTGAKVLLTTRLPVSDLEDRGGDALAGVFERELRELSREDAITFMQAQGVTKGTPTEIANVCEVYGYHALSLRLLSGLIRHDAKMPGDVKAAPDHDVHDDLVQRQHHVLEQSYDALRKRERALLSRLAAFRGPITYEALEVFRNKGEGTRFEAAIDDLRVRGLLQRDTEHNRYDLHPIVRHYAYGRLSEKAGVHARLAHYFADISVPDSDKVKNIDELAPVIELYHHTVRAGLYDEGFELFWRRLSELLYYKFGAYQICIELLRALCTDRQSQLPQLKTGADQAWTLNFLGICYSQSGQSSNALRSFELGITLEEAHGNRDNLGVELANMAAMAQIHLGEIKAAERNLRRVIELGRVIGDEFLESVGRHELSRVLDYRGTFDEAEAESLVAQEVFDRRYVTHQPNSFVAASRATRALRGILMGDVSMALAMAQESRKWAEEVAQVRFPHQADMVRVELILGAALVMEGRDLMTAAIHLTEALTRSRRISLVELEPDILLAWARWHRAQGNAKEAQTFAEEALAIADRCEYRLKQAEIHNFLSHQALDANDRVKARNEAEIAKERAWCDGPPYCYRPALDEAEKMLKALDAEN